MGGATILSGHKRMLRAKRAKKSFGMYPHLWHSEGTTQNKEKMELTIFVLSLVLFFYTVFLLLCSSSSSSSRFVERFTLMCYESRWAGTNESLMLIWNCSCWSLGAEENPVTMLSDHQIRDWDCSTICYSSLLRIKIFIFFIWMKKNPEPYSMPTGH